MDAYTAELADTGCQDGRACGQLIDEMNAQAKIPNRTYHTSSSRWGEHRLHGRHRVIVAEVHGQEHALILLRKISET